PHVEIKKTPSIVRTHEQKVTEHAARTLSKLTRQTEPDEVAQRFRAFLKLEEARLRIAHSLGAGGLWVARARSLVLDELVKQAFRIAVEPFAAGAERGAGTRLAVVALGGYGRRELAPFSDLDLLFLRTNRNPAETRERIAHVLRLLWDTGLTIGHKQHGASECVLVARSDPHFLTALFHARLVVGDKDHFERLTRAFERDREDKSRAFVASVRRERDLRRKKFGAVACVQEPHVKEGAGGLRDIHTATWAAYAGFGCRTLEEACARGLITRGQVLRAEAAHDFTLRVRNEAHWTSGRKTDRLALDLQPTLAARFGYKDGEYLRASESFMRDYYRSALELQRLGDSLLARASESRTRASRWFERPRRAPSDFAFSIGDGELHFDGGAALFAADTSLFFRAFSLAQSAGVSLSPALRDSISRSLYAVNSEFRASEKVTRDFLGLLRRGGATGRALRAMHETGFLCRYLPEFGRLHLLIQHDLYHHYTVDEHTLRAAESLDEIAGGAEQTGAAHFLNGVMGEVEDHALLYLSVLLHDIGKGRGSGHVARGARMSARICTRLGLDAESASKVIALVEHHTLMAHVSQRRDLNDPHTVRGFARKVGDIDTLNMLLLLTYADLNGVGPGVWSEWKGALLKELYTRARAELTGHTAQNFEAGESEQLKDAVVSEVAGRVSSIEVERHFALLPSRYALTVGAKTAATHILLSVRLADESIACDWSERASVATVLSLAARDRRGLFADVAGALAAQGVEILSADLHTRADGVAVDSLLLREAATGEPLPAHRLAPIERAVKSAVEGASDVAALVERWRTRNAPRGKRDRAHASPRVTTRIHFDNDVSEAATLVEVHAADEPGLAYKIASGLTARGLDITRARIATEKADALDVFYVTNGDGLKLSAAEMSAPEETLIEVIGKDNRTARDRVVGARPTSPAFVRGAR
ncbi:MAG: [protein-PII] uridylyltransferase, partial [Acidobacteriota bacterium]|nr:[protein-PII] uridylyltransferase [Acidobacteriota bacterium]